MDDGVAEEYKSSLADLNCNSKPLINMLTMLAEENIKYASDIVKTITDHVLAVSAEAKLPSLYLVDSIIKNVRKQYLNLFAQNIVAIFASVFEKVDETTRMLLYKLRQTWNEIFPNKILYAIDMKVKEMDPAWPITAQVPPQHIHVNPKFLDAANVAKSSPSLVMVKEEEDKLKAQQNEVLKQLFAKQEQLRLLEQKKRELATKQFLKPDMENATPISIASPAQGTAVDPRVVAKLNPKLSQRDPRLQKVVVANVLKKNLTQVKIIAKEDTATNSSPEPSTAPKSMVVAPGSVEKAKVESHLANKKAQGMEKEQVAPERARMNRSPDASMPIEKDSRKRYLEKPSLHKREDNSNLNNRGGRKKKKIEDLKKVEAREPTRISPRKLSKDKQIKKESPKKGSHVSAESKRYPTRRSKSPLLKSAIVKRSDQDERSFKNKKDNVSASTPKLSDNLRQETSDASAQVKEKEVDHKLKRDFKDEGKENVGEPPEKKVKESQSRDSETDSLFGHEDQDYRQLTVNDKTNHKGWAMYKAAHPDEFKKPERQFSINSDIENQTEFEEEKKFSEYDSLGRPRLPKTPRGRKFGYASSFQDRELDVRLPNRGFIGEKHFQEVILNSVMSDPKDVLRQAEERYRLGRISEADFNEIRNDLERVRDSEEFRKFKTLNDINRPFNFDHERKMPFPHANMKNYKMPKARNQSHVRPNESSHPGNEIPHTDVRTFRLDNKSRVIHFINDKAIVLVDNDEPRELTFRGEPTQVFISGLKPITLRFDGRPVEFELAGCVHSLKFGAPSRELYINNRPYEGKFGGPPFEVVLNGRLYRVSLGTPPPQVQVSEHPAHELYRKFIAMNRRKPEMLPPHGVNQNHPNEGPADPVPFDVDMRSDSLRGNRDPEVRDMDWRQMDAPSDADDGRNYEFYHRDSPTFRETNPQQTEHGFRDHMQENKEWDRRPFEPEFRPFPPDQARHDWRKPPPPRFQDMEMSHSPHSTPPQENWEHGHPPRPFEPEKPKPYDPQARPWVSKEFSQSGPDRPPAPEHNVPFNMQRPPAPHFAPRPDFHEGQIRGPPNFSICPPPRPGFNPRGMRPELMKRPPIFPTLPRPPMPPWMNNPRPMSGDALRAPVLPPPPRPPMHLQIPEGFVRPCLPNVPTCIPPSGGRPSINVPNSGPNALVPGMVLNVAPPAMIAMEQTLPNVIEPTVGVPVTVNAMLPMKGVNSQVTSGTEETTANVPTIEIPQTLNLDVSTLFAKLVAAGIISEGKEVKTEPAVKESEEEKDAEPAVEKETDPNEEIVPPIELKLNCLKTRYSGVTSALYRGSQCASCGMRFKEIQGERYSRHLDWHFRVNRREKDGVKKAFSRKWYYEIEDWIQFAEFEDFEERARSFFELQADEQFQDEADVEVPSVPASGQETEACVVCGEPFQLFWVEEEEEWHLRNAVRHEEQAYHPSCYEDFKKSIETPAKEEVSQEEVKEEVADKVLVEVKEEPKDGDDEPEDNLDEVIQEVIDMLTDATVQDLECKVKEEVKDELPEVGEDEEMVDLSVVKVEPEEVELQGKPGEEEIIGVIAESDLESEPSPTDDSDKVVFRSGGITMKVRAESLKPASPSLEAVREKNETEEEEEFRPPTPDPRFKVLPPVQKGSQLSGFCCIM